MPFPRRWRLAVECVFVLFASTAGPGAFQVWLNGAESAGAYWMVVGVPATAAILFLILSSLVPSLFAVGSLRFPLQLTLPLVFTVLLPVCAALWLTTSVELVRAFDVTRYARVWQLPGELLLTGSAQVCGLSILALLRGDESSGRQSGFLAKGP